MRVKVWVPKMRAELCRSDLSSVAALRHEIMLDNVSDMVYPPSGGLTSG